MDSKLKCVFVLPNDDTSSTASAAGAADVSKAESFAAKSNMPSSPKVVSTVPVEWIYI